MVRKRKSKHDSPDHSDDYNSLKRSVRNDRTTDYTPHDDHLTSKYPSLRDDHYDRSTHADDSRYNHEDRRDERDYRRDDHIDRSAELSTGASNYDDRYERRRDERSDYRRSEAYDSAGPERERDRDRDRRRRSRSPAERDRVDRDRRNHERDRTKEDRDRKPERRKPEIKLHKVPETVKSPEEADMFRLMGFCDFDTTHGKHVEGNVEGAACVVKPRRYRQYMNRKGGFNRRLDSIK